MYVNQDKTVSSLYAAPSVCWLHQQQQHLRDFMCPWQDPGDKASLLLLSLFPTPSAKALCLRQLQCSNLVPTPSLFSGDHTLWEATAAEFECQSWCNEEVADKP